MALGKCNVYDRIRKWLIMEQVAGVLRWDVVLTSFMVSNRNRGTGLVRHILLCTRPDCYAHIRKITVTTTNTENTDGETIKCTECTEAAEREGRTAVLVDTVTHGDDAIRRNLSNASFTMSRREHRMSDTRLSATAAYTSLRLHDYYCSWVTDREHDTELNADSRRVWKHKFYTLKEILIGEATT